MFITSIANDIALYSGELRGVPSVQPRNVGVLNEHYIGHTPNERVVTLGQGLSSLALSPDIEISPENRDDILHHTENGGVIIIVGNHVKGIDPLTYSAVVCKEPGFEVVKHDIIIPAKPIIFRIPGIRHLAEGMGAFPVIRKKDVVEKDGTITEENEKFQAVSGKFALDLMVNHLVNGGSGTVLAEGTRNRGNPLEVQEFEKGASLMYTKALKEGAKVALLPAGVVYDSGSMFRATVHIGGLFEPVGNNLKQKTESLRSEVQHSVTEARRIGYRNR